MEYKNGPSIIEVIKQKNAEKQEQENQKCIFFGALSTLRLVAEIGGKKPQQEPVQEHHMLCQPLLNDT